VKSKGKSKPSVTRKAPDDLRGEYDFSTMKARPNRFAAQMQQGGALVVIDPDVASVFRDSSAINELLRSVIKAMHPKAPRRKSAA
jgi:hypothetical protein